MNSCSSSDRKSDLLPRILIEFQRVKTKTRMGVEPSSTPIRLNSKKALKIQLYQMLLSWSYVFN